MVGAFHALAHEHDSTRSAHHHLQSYSRNDHVRTDFPVSDNSDLAVMRNVQKRFDFTVTTSYV